MSSSLLRSFLVLVGPLVALFVATEARAQCYANPIPGEPPICEAVAPPPVETGTLTRGGNLVLPPGAAQAGGGPGIDVRSGRLGLPLSAAYGLNDTIELGVGWTSYLTPPPWRANYFGPWLQQMFVSNLTLYGRFSLIPKKLAIAPKLMFGGPLIDRAPFTPLLGQADCQYTTELASMVRLYWVNNLTFIVGGGFQGQLQSSATFMFLLTDLFYAQALLGTGTGFAVGSGSSSVLAPVLNYPVQVGTGGGILTGENQGIGLAFQIGLVQPTETAPGISTGPVTNAGIVATWVKAI